MTERTPAELAQRVADLMMEHDAFSKWLGIEFLEIAPAKAVIRMTVRPEMCNGFGVCHGGVTFAFADSAFAFACNTQGNLAVSIENSITYPAAIRPGDVLTATAVEATKSNRILYYHVDVTKQDGSVVGLFRGTGYRTEKRHPVD
ncbi:MAG: hydroxyphenylacetyl-CoA thioesterase PaaI [Gemmatimonadales bacterium]|nr:hydroxyphenylacetyl-CoA thioesterase PaaI [Gemmatimonadota bacterium]MDX2058734.1 hydroxyphenylacetyl-CoA thioesterase PaaI [Gemmatimonadales bacterium]